MLSLLVVQLTARHYYWHDQSTSKGAALATKWLDSDTELNSGLRGDSQLRHVSESLVVCSRITPVLEKKSSRKDQHGEALVWHDIISAFVKFD